LGLGIQADPAAPSVAVHGLLAGSKNIPGI